MHDREYRAIDPLALILSNAAYVRLTLPDPNPEELKAAARQIAQRLDPNERRVILENIRAFETAINAIEGELRQGAEVERPQVRAR